MEKAIIKTTNSSNIESFNIIGDDLYVRFRNNTIYRYTVSLEVLVELYSLKDNHPEGFSWGKWFNKNVKNVWPGFKVNSLEGI